MSTIRDTLINLRPLEIPRPQVSNFQFISTRGRYGFYKVCYIEEEIFISYFY